MPKVSDEALYLISLLDEIGATMQTAMGICPMTWQELNSWSVISGVYLTYWELALIKELSYEYTAELSNATDPDRKPPYFKPEQSFAVPNLDDKFRSAFAAFKKQDTKKGL